MQTNSAPISMPRLRVWPFVVAIVVFFLVGAVASVLGPRFGDTSSPPTTSFEAVRTNAGSPSANLDVDVGGGEFPLNEQQRRGKQIYLTCTSPSGNEISARLGNSTTVVPAAVLTCVNCHRHDGRGKPEGGIFPANIRWDDLTKPYGVQRPHGQSRPPYDESLLKRCVTMGLNPAGTRLDDAMPRYRMTHRDLADLVAYLKVIGNELDPGLSLDKIRIGVILAPRMQFDEMHVAVRAATTAFVEEFNRQGGVYGREIELCFHEAPVRIEDRAGTAAEFVNRERVFALAGSFIAGAEGDITRQLDRDGVPLVGAATLNPQLDFPLNRYVFYLNSGLNGQGRALMKFAIDRESGSRPIAAIVFPDEERLALVASEIEGQCRNLGIEVQMRRIGAGAWRPDVFTKELMVEKIGIVFSLLSAPQNLQLLNAADACNWYPKCFVPGAIVGPRIFAAPSGFDLRIFLSFPTLPSRQPGGMKMHDVLAQRHELPAVQVAAQFEALAALQVLVHGLEQTGATPSRERLVEQLEGLYEYRPGFTGPVTYGPNRRVGAAGAYIVTVDLTNKKLMPVSDWIDGSPASPLAD